MPHTPAVTAQHTTHVYTHRSDHTHIQTHSSFGCICPSLRLSCLCEIWRAFLLQMEVMSHDRPEALWHWFFSWFRSKDPQDVMIRLRSVMGCFTQYDSEGSQQHHRHTWHALSNWHSINIPSENLFLPLRHTTKQQMCDIDMCVHNTECFCRSW